MNRRTRELIKQLQSESPKERYLAAAELAKRKDIEALPALNKVATFDQNENVRTMAYNAVRFLSQIKNQMDQEELRRRVLQSNEDDDSDDSHPLWSEDDDDDDDDDSKDDIRVTAADLGISGSFLFGEDDDNDDDEVRPSSKKTRKGKRKKSPQSEAVRRARRERRKRANFKMVLWLSALLAVIALTLAVREEYTEPRTREDAIQGLDIWLEQMIETTGVYTTALSGTSFDCSSFQNNSQFNIPEGPEWAARDGKNQENLDDFFDGMEAAQERLITVKRTLEQLCAREGGATIDLPPAANLAQQVSEVSILHLSKAANALDEARQNLAE